MIPLKDICHLITDGKHGDCQDEENSGFYFISCKDVKEGFIDKDYNDRIIKRPQQRELVKHYALMWSLLSFEIWYKIYIKDGKIETPRKNIEYYIR